MVIGTFQCKSALVVAISLPAEFGRKLPALLGGYCRLENVMIFIACELT